VSAKIEDKFSRWFLPRKRERVEYRIARRFFVEQQPHIETIGFTLKQCGNLYRIIERSLETFFVVRANPNDYGKVVFCRVTL
jgi:hypothetical protein